jgi:hypothetical protein
MIMADTLFEKVYSFHLKPENMGYLLYVVAVVLILIWAISFLGGFYTGGLIHLLLVIAIIAILLRVISGRRPI